MYDFNYHRPSSLDEAKSLLRDHEEATLLAGGMTLLPTLKQRLAQPSDLIDLNALRNAGIEVSGSTVTVKGGTTHGEVAGHDGLKQAIPALAKLAGSIGDPAVRYRGTIGGSIANNDPAADYPSAVVALDATVVTTDRRIGADEFFTGMFETALERDEIVAAVEFNVPSRAGYSKFPNPASRYPLVGVFVSDHGGGNVRVAVIGAGPCVFRHTAMEEALANDFSADAIAEIASSADELNEDIHASGEYRAHLIGVMARRAVAAAG